MHDTLFIYMLLSGAMSKVVTLYDENGQSVILAYHTLKDATKPELVQKIKELCDLNNVCIELQEFHRIDTLQVFQGKRVQTH
jgi:hypothetical protein